MSANHYDLELEELTRNSVGRLRTSEVFDPQAFYDLKAYIWSKSEALRDESTISKQLLKCLRDATEVITIRADYLPEAKEHLAMAYEFMHILDCLILGEVQSDRTPGVPRIT